MPLPDPKPGHEMSEADTLPFGETVYVVVRHDGKLITVCEDRHTAVGVIPRLHEADDYRIEAAPAGRVRWADVADNVET